MGNINVNTSYYDKDFHITLVSSVILKLECIEIVLLSLSISQTSNIYRYHVINTTFPLSHYASWKRSATQLCTLIHKDRPGIIAIKSLCLWYSLGVGGLLASTPNL